MRLADGTVNSGKPGPGSSTAMADVARSVTVDARDSVVPEDNWIMGAVMETFSSTREPSANSVTRSSAEIEPPPMRKFPVQVSVTTAISEEDATPVQSWVVKSTLELDSATSGVRAMHARKAESSFMAGLRLEERLNKPR
jgi:hypothetical protein